ncbi:MAG: hypothetical protein U0T36_03270 [Saprospiraceae bacterium]
MSYCSVQELRIYYKPLAWKSDISLKLAGGTYNQAPLYRELRKPDGSINQDLKSQNPFI